MQLQIHLHQGLLHMLDMGRGVFHQSLTLPQIGPQGRNLRCRPEASEARQST